MGYKAWNKYEAENRKREREEFRALPLAGRLWVYAKIALFLGCICAVLYPVFVR